METSSKYFEIHGGQVGRDEIVELLKDLKEKQRATIIRSFSHVLIVGVLILTLTLFLTPVGKTVRDEVSYIIKKSSSPVASSATLRRVGYNALDHFDPSMANSHLQYVFLEDYSAIIEPSASMELYFYDMPSLSESSVSYEFTVCPNDDPSQSCQQGSMYYDSNSDSTIRTSVTLSCTAHSTYTVSVFAVDSEDDLVGMQTIQAICLYVRREIRSLTTSDLDAFLDASYTMSTVSQEEGESLYGSNYYSALSLAKLHFYNAAQRDADHLHEGNGFLTQHIKLQAFFTSAIQAINPAVISPYWDFTIDSNEGKSAFDCYLASPDLYGTLTYPKGDMSSFTKADNAVEDARISDGRWADLKQEMNTYFPDLYAGYGYMRAPWALNPSPYVSRYAYDWDVKQSTLPTCSRHYDILTMTDDMMNFFNDMTYAPHIAAHTSYGGIYGCDEINYWLEIGLVDNVTMQENACTAMVGKTLYRDGFIDIEKDCTIITSNYANSNCSFLCRDEDTRLNAVETFYSYVGDYLNKEIFTISEIYEVLEGFICGNNEGMGKLYVGEHYEAASITDPTFWVLHPPLERLLQAKLLSGGFNDESWESDSVDDFVCLASPCYHEDTDTTDYFDDCCYGHYEDDRLYDGLTGTRDAYVGVSNGDILTASDPRSSDYSVDYVYDTFEWRHCEDSGYDIDSLLTDLYDEYTEVNGLTEARRVYGNKKYTKVDADSNGVPAIKTKVKGIKRYLKKDEKHHGKMKLRPYEIEVDNRIKSIVEMNKIRFKKAKQLEKKRISKGHTRSQFKSSKSFGESRKNVIEKMKLKHRKNH